MPNGNTQIGYHLMRSFAVTDARIQILWARYDAISVSAARRDPECAVKAEAVNQMLAWDMKIA